MSLHWLRVRVQARRPDREAPAEQVRVAELVSDRRLLVVDAAGAAERVDVLVVPRLLGPGGRRLRRVDEQGELVDATVGRPGDPLHDERNGLALVGRRLLNELRRRRVRRVVHDELGRAREVAVEELDLRRRIALRVGRRAERGVRLVLGPAEPRLDLRPGEDRPADRVILDLRATARRRSLASRGGGCSPSTRPVTSPSNLPLSRTANELVMFAPFELDPSRLRVCLQIDGHQCVAARDQVGAVRQDIDLADPASSGRTTKHRRSETGRQPRPRRWLARLGFVAETGDASSLTPPSHRDTVARATEGAGDDRHVSAYLI